jgi:hypothetical protein
MAAALVNRAQLAADREEKLSALTQLGDLLLKKAGRRGAGARR